MNPQFIDVGQEKIRYVDTGGSGPAVLLTHGIGESLEFWEPQIEALGKSMRLVAWDMPGHGESDIPASAMDLQSVARSAWLLLDKLGIESVHLVGNSLGAAVSVRMVAQNAARARSLLLANMATLGSEVFPVFKLMTLPLLGELMTKPNAKSAQMQINSIVHRAQSVTPQLRLAIERNLQQLDNAAYFLATLRMLTSLRGQRQQVYQESHRLLRELRLPTLVIHGQQDSVLPVKHSEQAHQLVKGSELQVWDDCGHTPQIEKPAQFNASLTALVQRATV